MEATRHARLVRMDTSCPVCNHILRMEEYKGRKKLAKDSFIITSNRKPRHDRPTCERC